MRSSAAAPDSAVSTVTPSIRSRRASGSACSRARSSSTISTRASLIARSSSASAGSPAQFLGAGLRFTAAALQRRLPVARCTVKRLQQRRVVVDNEYASLVAPKLRRDLLEFAGAVLQRRLPVLRPAIQRPCANRAV